MNGVLTVLYTPKGYIKSKNISCYSANPSKPKGFQWINIYDSHLISQKCENSKEYVFKYHKLGSLISKLGKLPKTTFQHAQ